jgi:hypothetical protein
MDDKERKARLQLLSAKFHVPLRRVFKFTGDDPKYRLETEIGSVDLGDVAGLIDQAKLRKSIAACTGLYLPRFKAKHWPQYAQLLLGVCEEVERGPDATTEGTTFEWISGYLDQRPPHPNIAQADPGREPFFRDGAVHVFASDLKRWLKAQVDERISRNDLTARLRAFGAEPVKVDLTVDGKPTSRSTWRLPEKVRQPMGGS